MKILKYRSVQTTARVVSVGYRLWQPFLINKVLSLTKLRSVILYIPSRFSMNKNFLRPEWIKQYVCYYYQRTFCPLGSVRMRIIPPRQENIFNKIPPYSEFSPTKKFNSFEMKFSPPNRDLAYSWPRAGSGGEVFSRMNAFSLLSEISYETGSKNYSIIILYTIEILKYKV